MKITTDVRWMASGPRAGLAELHLPEVQPGSSIMPAKVNPVIAEALAMVCARVIGNDAAITLAGLSGNFELNAMLPLIAVSLLESVELLANAVRVFATRCIAGATANQPRLQRAVQDNLMAVTALVPRIGYTRAVAIAREAENNGRSIRDVARERTGLSVAEIDALLGTGDSS